VEARGRAKLHLPSRPVSPADGAAVISYCVAVHRPLYARMLIADLVKKTSAPFEILIWMNAEAEVFDAFVADRAEAGWPIAVVGRTPDNIGMRAYLELFRASRYPLIVQIDDDVLCVSRGIAERAQRIFDLRADVRQIVADVWQDDLTTGARPPLAHYRCVDEGEGLFHGPIDGWFSIYHRSLLPLLLSLPIGDYFPIGAAVQSNLAQRGQLGVLCTRMKVFHAIGPAYASFFGMLGFEVAKYRRLGRTDIVTWYESEALPPQDELRRRFAALTIALERDGPWPTSSSGPS
jgi:hypothetical protein